MNDQITNQYLTFRMDEEHYAASVMEVESVLDYTEITRIPGCEEAMRGVINLRGKALPVIDLRLKVGMKEKAVTQDTAIVVLTIEQGGESLTTGVLVDSVEEVIYIDDEEIQPAPQIGLKIDSSFIRGITNKDDQFVIILNIKRIFSQKELEIMTQVQQESQTEEPVAASSGSNPSS